MKKIKIIALIIILFTITGCSGNYNLSFNKDLSVEEKLDIRIDNDEDNYEKTYKLFDTAKIEQDKYQIISEKEYINIIYTEKYKSFEDYYLNSHIYKMLFDEIEFKKDNTGMTISTESKFKLNDKNNQNIINSYNIDNFDINIKIPFDVNKNNADKIDNDVYTWILNDSDTYKKIDLDFSYQNDRIQNIVVLVIIGMASIFIIGFIVKNLIRNKRI